MNKRRWLVVLLTLSLIAFAILYSNNLQNKQLRYYSLTTIEVILFSVLNKLMYLLIPVLICITFLRNIVLSKKYNYLVIISLFYSMFFIGLQFCLIGVNVQIFSVYTTMIDTLYIPGVVFGLYLNKYL